MKPSSDFYLAIVIAVVQTHPIESDITFEYFPKFLSLFLSRLTLYCSASLYECYKEHKTVHCWLFIKWLSNRDPKKSFTTWKPNAEYKGAFLSLFWFFCLVHFSGCFLFFEKNVSSVFGAYSPFCLCAIALKHKNLPKKETMFLQRFCYDVFAVFSSLPSRKKSYFNCTSKASIIH